MSQETILIIDDEPSIAESMKDLLEDKNHHVLAVNNGVEGLRICAEQRIKLIVLDLMMPRMDGYMFMERLTERWEKDGRRFDLPRILIMTAMDYKSDFGLSHNLGANKFLTKPFKPKEFLAVVEELLKG